MCVPNHINLIPNKKVRKLTVVILTKLTKNKTKFGIKRPGNLKNLFLNLFPALHYEMAIVYLGL